MADINARVAQLRKLMKERGLDAYIINGTDPHQSEYVCPRWRTRAFITGFTGSAGTAVVTADSALLWVDSRYFIQSAKEIDGTCWIQMKSGQPDSVEFMDWIRDNLKPGSKVGISADTLMTGAKKYAEEVLAAKGIELVPTEDLLSMIWRDRPVVPESKIVEIPPDVAGLSAADKISAIRAAYKKKGCEATFVSSLDDIAWILNMRADDIAFNPVFLSYLLIRDDKAFLFTSPSRFDADQLEAMKPVCEVLPYGSAAEKLPELLKDVKKIYLSLEKTNLLIRNAIGNRIVVDGRDFSTDMKAAKNPVELEGMRRAHLWDGIALVNFMAGLDKAKVYTEYELTELLAAERAKTPEYLGPSFNPIAGFAAHGAMPHYAPSGDRSDRIEGSGLVVLDTGGQYVSGMTDVTRTLLFGKATREQKHDYTLVLKGNLAIAAQRFPEGTNGYQLDVLARQYLWQYGLSYSHGTGHGVGFRLNVHEGPQSISPRLTSMAPLVPGMVISDEPGVYKEGRYGIRIENVIAVKPDFRTEFGRFFAFEVLTICPFERKLIDVSLLSEQERLMVDSYHAWCYAELSQFVDADTKAWLKKACAPLKERKSKK